MVKQITINIKNNCKSNDDGNENDDDDDKNDDKDDIFNMFKIIREQLKKIERQIKELAE